MANNALIDLGKLSKPAEILVNRVSDAVGGLARPGQIRRIAKANAEAAIVEANAEVEVAEIHRRALVRWVNEQAKEQLNIESVLTKSIEMLGDDADPNKLDDDWLYNFFQHARHVSDVDMQAIWAKILSCETSRSGSYSRNTLSILKNMGSQEAAIFQKLSAAFIYIENENPLTRTEVPYVPAVILQGATNAELKLLEIDHDDLVCLESMSLLKIHSGFGEYAFEYEEDKGHVQIKYGNEMKRLPLSENMLRVGGGLLTKWGVELASVVDWSISELYTLDVINEYLGVSQNETDV